MSAPVIIPKNSREEIRIGREEWQGHDLINIRVWAGIGGDERKPTKKGLALKQELAEQVADAIRELIGGAQ